MQAAMKTVVTSCLTAAVLLASAMLCAQPVAEYDLKAAFVFNFALFAEWPAATRFEDGALNICVHPGSALHTPLNILSGKPVKGRKVMLRQVAEADDLHGCHLLVVDAGNRDRWPQMRKALSAGGVLVVTDDEEIGRQGAIVTLAMEGQRVVFDIDLKAARQAGLVLSSKLLRLARSVN
jgi:hypothetical protein